MIFTITKNKTETCEEFATRVIIEGMELDENLITQLPERTLVQFGLINPAFTDIPEVVINNGNGTFANPEKMDQFIEILAEFCTPSFNDIHLFLEDTFTTKEAVDFIKKYGNAESEYFGEEVEKGFEEVLKDYEEIAHYDFDYDMIEDTPEFHDWWLEDPFNRIDNMMVDIERYCKEFK